MKLQTTRNRYKATNCELTISEDLTRVYATSYDWWTFIDVDKVGNVFFNDTNYSGSTNSHQRETEGILDRLGIDINFTFNNCRDSLNRDLKVNFNIEIDWHRTEIKEMIGKIKTKGSWKKVNAQRRAVISKYLFAIKDLRNYRDNFLNKREIKVKKETPSFNKWNPAEEYNSTCSGYVYYFINKNTGKINTQGLSKVLNKISSGYGIDHDAPTSIDAIRELFNLNPKYDLTDLLVYPYTQDLNGMLPQVDSKERLQLDKWLTRMNIDKTNLTTFSLDKVHTYLVEKMNRKTYVPSEPNLFPVHEKLIELESVTEKLTIIKHDRQLRAEGRKQSHCIGDKNYIDQCHRGYQALNYKGYTFFLTSGLEIVSSSGRHNSHTPHEIESELKKLVV